MTYPQEQTLAAPSGGLAHEDPPTTPYNAPHKEYKANPDVPLTPALCEIGPISIREFDTGATRDQDTTKFDYEGFLSSLALTRFAAYMHDHRVQSDGTLRASDNWQKGIPRDSYMKSLWRHLMTVWRHHRNVTVVSDEEMDEALCGVIFNAQGYLHENIKAKRSVPLDIF